MKKCISLKRWRSLMLLLSALSLLLPSLISPAASATDLAMLVSPIAFSSDYGNSYVGNSGCQTPQVFLAHNANSSSYCYVTYVDYQHMFENLGWGVNSNYYIKFSVYYYDLRDKEELNTLINGPASLHIIYVDSSGGIIGQESSVLLAAVNGFLISDSSAQIDYIFSLSPPNNYGIIRFPYLTLNVGLAPNEYFSSGPVSLYVRESLNSTVNIDTQSIVDAIQAADNASGIAQQTQELQAQTSLLQQQLDAQEAQTDAINAQTEQEKEQYEAEKQEESEREQAGQDSAGELGGAFNFNVINPFTGILGMFTSGASCVSIPTIAGMLGAESTTYCPWFSASVRNILTPVIGMSSTILLFGFIVGWLKSDSLNGKIKANLWAK